MPSAAGLSQCHTRDWLSLALGNALSGRAFPVSRQALLKALSRAVSLNA